MAYRCILVVLGLLILQSIAEEHGQDTAGHDNQPHEPQEHSRLRDSKHVHDKEHIKEHLKEVTDVKEESMSDDDLQFHYFKLHDNDGNDKLDGIELANAMTHFHEEENSQAGDSSNVPQYTDEQLAGMIDQILEEDDGNKDGYIDYSEFVGAQKRADDTESEEKPNAS